MTDQTDPTDPLDSAHAARPRSPRSITSPNFPPSPRSHQRRRSSFAELFASRPSIDTGSTSRQQLQAAQQAQQQQQQSPPGAQSEAGRGMSTVFGDPARTRRLSITTLGLSGSPSHSGQGMQTSPFSSLRGRGKSMSTGFAGDGSTTEQGAGESAIDESDEVPPMKESPPQGRRVSFGARAYGSAGQRSGSIAGLTGVQQGVGSPGVAGTNGAPTAAGSEKEPSPISAKTGSPPSLRRSGMSSCSLHRHNMIRVC